VIHIQTPHSLFFAARVVREARRVQGDSARIVPYARYRKNLGMSPGRRMTCKLSHTANKGRSYGPTTRQLLESLAHLAELASVAELGKQPTAGAETATTNARPSPSVSERPVGRESNVTAASAAMLDYAGGEALDLEFGCSHVDDASIVELLPRGLAGTISSDSADEYGDYRCSWADGPFDLSDPDTADLTVETNNGAPTMSPEDERERMALDEQSWYETGYASHDRLVAPAWTWAYQSVYGSEGPLDIPEGFTRFDFFYVGANGTFRCLASSPGGVEVRVPDVEAACRAALDVALRREAAAPPASGTASGVVPDKGNYSGGDALTLEFACEDVDETAVEAFLTRGIASRKFTDPAVVVSELDCAWADGTTGPDRIGLSTMLWEGGSLPTPEEARASMSANEAAWLDSGYLVRERLDAPAWTWAYYSVYGDTSDIASLGSSPGKWCSGFLR